MEAWDVDEFGFINNKPDRIYKFYSINNDFINTLKENYLWLSKPSDFNDPFDCNPNLIYINPNKDEIKSLLKRQTLSGNRTERRKYINAHIKKHDLLRSTFLCTRKTTIDKWGVCCFTLNYKNNLMWSHYANKHTGICLGFDPKESIRTFHLVNINYTDNFQPIDFYKHRHKAIYNVVTTKSSDWRYEEELRIFRNEHGKLPFNKPALKEVIFGCKIDPIVKTDLINLLNENNYHGIIFKQASMRKDCFSLDFEEFSS